MDQISNYKPYSHYELATIEHILGIDETNVDCFNISNRARKTYLLIGCNEDLNKIRVLDSESIGLRFNIFRYFMCHLLLDQNSLCQDDLVVLLS